MSLIQPQATDTTLSGDHAHLHRVLAVDSSAPNESVVVGSTGNVGIGTTNPLGKLVISNSGANGLEITPGTTSFGLTNVNYITAYDRSLSAYKGIVFDTGAGVPTLALQETTGNVGIGTTSPTVKLDVNGNILVEGYNYLYFTSGNNAIYSSDGNSLSLYTNGANILNLSTDVYTNAWSDYSASSTISGFSAISGKSIYTKKVGKTVFVNFSLSGTSNATTITFTLPYESASAPTTTNPILTLTNSTQSIGIVYMGASTYTVSVYPTASEGNWTNGASFSIGQFWYQSN